MVRRGDHRVGVGPTRQAGSHQQVYVDASHRREDDVPVLRDAAGIDVKRIQMRLNVIFGTDLNGDGEYGPITKEAVSAFQEREGMAKTGIVDAQTWERLFALS